MVVTRRNEDGGHTPAFRSDHRIAAEYRMAQGEVKKKWGD